MKLSECSKALSVNVTLLRIKAERRLPDRSVRLTYELHIGEQVGEDAPERLIADVIVPADTFDEAPRETIEGMVIQTVQGDLGEAVDDFIAKLRGEQKTAA